MSGAAIPVEWCQVRKFLKVFLDLLRSGLYHGHTALGGRDPSNRRV